MLSLKKVSRKYAGNQRFAVEEVSLEVREGEMIALVGESGSGKSTLLRLIAGLEIPDAGEIAIDGTMMADESGKIFVPPEKRKVGFVFQDGALFPHLTVSKNVAYGLSEKDRKKRGEIVSGMLRTVGLSDLEERFPHEISGGERQRLAVARALAPEPKLVLLDEPFSNLDPPLRRTLRAEIHRILSSVQATAIMVTHDTDDALAMADRVAVIRDSRIEQVGSPVEVFQTPVSGYVARLFGPANCVNNNGGGILWARPEHMVLDRDSGEFPVEILRIRETGRHVEVTVKSVNRELSKDENWSLHLDDRGEFREGDQARVSLKRN